MVKQYMIEKNQHIVNHINPLEGVLFGEQEPYEALS